MGDDNKSATVKVLGEIIQSYTPMAGYDRKAFGRKSAAAKASHDCNRRTGDALSIGKSGFERLVGRFVLGIP